MDESHRGDTYDESYNVKSDYNGNYDRSNVIEINAIGMLDSDTNTAEMTSEDQCKALLARVSPDVCLQTFMRSIVHIIAVVEDRMMSKEKSSHVPDLEQNARYEAEFDTWLSYAVLLLDSPPIIQGKKHAVVNLIDLCIYSKWDYAVRQITHTITELYKKEAWAHILTDFFENGLDKDEWVEAAGYSPWDSVPILIDTRDRINLYISILQEIGSDVMRICKIYWTKDARICIKYLQYLLQKDEKLLAGRIASIGLEHFPRSTKLAAISVKVFEPSDPRLLKAYCRAYATGLDMKYYRLATSSPHWNKDWARRLAEMLAAENSDEGISVLVDAGLYAEGLDMLYYNGSLQAALLHQKTFAELNPDRYYMACRTLVASVPKKGKNRAHHTMILKCLVAMKAIPEHESDFNNFCTDMLENDSMLATLQKSIKRLMTN